MKKIFCLFVCIQLSAILSAQDITPPDKPEIQYVSVDTISGDTHIYWKESSATDIMWYYIYYEISTVNGLEGVKLDSLSRGSDSYVHQGAANRESTLYSISAIDSSGNESLRTPGLHSTVFVSSAYDSCSNQLLLSWTPYTGWGDKISGYRVYLRKEGEAYPPPEGVEKEMNSFVFDNIAENTSYGYFIEALNTDTLISVSNLGNTYTYMPGPPEELTLTSVDATASSFVDVYFEYSDTSGINSFQLQRSLNPDSGYVLVAVLQNLSPGTHNFRDSIYTSSERFFYKVGALNSCNAIFSESGYGSNILLSGTPAETYNELHWSPYLEWPNGVEQYQIYLIDESGNSSLLTSLDGNSLSYIHDLGNRYGQGNSGTLQYQVLAKEQGTEGFSLSNIVKLEVNSRFTMPNAFTPNDDGKNDLFRPVFSLLPENFEMRIYDRNGIMVFQSKNPMEGWDGRIRNGEKAPGGVYVYHIQYTSYSGSNKTYTGRVTVFYP